MILCSPYLRGGNWGAEQRLKIWDRAPGLVLLKVDGMEEIEYTKADRIMGETEGLVTYNEIATMWRVYRSPWGRPTECNDEREHVAIWFWDVGLLDYCACGEWSSMGTGMPMGILGGAHGGKGSLPPGKSVSAAKRSVAACRGGWVLGVMVWSTRKMQWG